MASPVRLEGGVDEGFGPVADAFAETFRRHGEAGAGVAVVRGGRRIVDLAGGVADRRSGSAFTRDTAAPVFSAGKGMVAVATAVAVSAGVVRLDDPIAEVWPDFASAGKGCVTLRQVLDHRSGVVLFGRRMRAVDFADPSRVEAVLAAARPLWRPGTATGYHLATLGDLVATVLRRTDPNGRGFAELFRDTVARPLGAAVAFGLDGGSPGPLAHLRLPRPRTALADLGRADRRLLFALRPGRLLSRTLAEVRRLDPNDRTFLGPAFPSANGIATAVGLATVYGAVATGGARLGLRPDVLADVLSDPDETADGRADLVLGVPVRFRLGFTRPGGAFRYSPSPRAFGAPGLGGSFAFGDPDTGTGYAYVPSRLGLLPYDDVRERTLRDALYRCLR